LRVWMRSIPWINHGLASVTVPFATHGKLLFIIGMIFLSATACSVHRTSVRTEAGKRVEYGKASWYGKKFHGRLTANGEVYDMYRISAAHKTLPLGSKVKVTNRKNGKSLVVRINDRGPFIRGRIIDLSYGGAKALGMVEDGVVPARVEIIELGDNRYYSSKKGRTSSGSMTFTVQVGSFLKKENALHLKRSLDSMYNTVFIREWNDRKETFYRVRVGKYTREEDAQKISRRLQKQNYSAFVTAD